MASWELVDLTTVHSDVTMMTQTAADLLVDRIADPTAPFREVKLDPVIIARRSHHRLS